jgi:tetracycline repressor-like protein
MINDKRAIRSRQLLRDALLGLLQERRYEDISVRDVIERAGVARSTFYSHYLDKDDLLVGPRGVFAREAKSRSEPSPSGQHKAQLIPPTCFWINILSHRETLRMIAKDSAMDVTMKDLHEKLCARMRASLEHDQSLLEGIPSSLAVDHLAGSVITLVRWWVKQGMTYPPEQIDRIFHQIAIPMVCPSQFSHSYT